MITEDDLIVKNFKDRDLTGEDFSGMDLTNALFRGAILDGCNFTGANLTGANLRDTSIEGAIFTDAEMFYSNVQDSIGTADFTNSKVFGCPPFNNFNGANFIMSPPLKKERVNLLFIEILKQTPGMAIEDFTSKDREVIRYWRAGKGRFASLTGSYPIVNHRRNLYGLLGYPGSEADDPLEVILNLAMEQNVSFNPDTDLFYK